MCQLDDTFSLRLFNNQRCFVADYLIPENLCRTVVFMLLMYVFVCMCYVFVMMGQANATYPGVCAALQSRPAAVPVLLQPLHEPHAEPAFWAQALCSGQAEDGGDATAQHVLDWGAVSKEGCGRAVPVPLHAHVHLRLCLLPQEEQPVHHFWGMTAGKLWAQMSLIYCKQTMFSYITNAFCDIYFSCQHYFWVYCFSNDSASERPHCIKLVVRWSPETGCTTTLREMIILDNSIYDRSCPKK